MASPSAAKGTPRKKRNYSSIMWSYFIKMPDDSTKVTCKICLKVLTRSSTNTTQLHRHIRSKHPNVYMEARVNEDKIREDVKFQEVRSLMSAISEREYTVSVQNVQTSGLKKRRSVAWDFFEKEGPNHVKCNLCGVIKVHHGRNTTDLFRHLKSHHKPSYAEAMTRNRSRADSGLISSNSTSNPSLEIKADFLPSVTKSSSPHSELNFLEQKETPIPQKTLKTDLRRKRKSVVWDYFIKVETGKVKCNLCGIVKIHHWSNTTDMFRHLKKKHASVFVEAVAPKRSREDSECYGDFVSPLPEDIEDSCKSDFSISTSAGTPPSKLMASTMSRKLTNSDRSRNKVNKSLIKLISVNLLPPSIVEIKEFKEMLKALDSRYELPTKTAVLKTLIPEFAEEVKKKLKADVDSASHFALTVETWTYRHEQKCVTVMAHFIKDSWETSAVALETVDYPAENSSCESLIEEMKRITDEWGISDKVVSLISDHYEMLSTAALTLGWEHLSCFGDELNNVIVPALDFLPQVTIMLKKVKDVSEYFNKSLKASDYLLSVQQQHNLPEHRLKTDLEYKWVSTYRMMERMSEQFEAANTVLCYHGKDDMCLCDEDIELMRSVAKILKPFVAVVSELSNNEFSSMSKVIPFRNVLLEVLGKSSDDLTETFLFLSTLKDFLVQQMESKFGNVERNSTLAICTLLDPRFKHHAFTDSAAMETAQGQLLQEMKSIAESLPGECALDKVETGKEVELSLLSMWTSFDKRVSEAGAKKSLSSEVENESRRYFKEALISRDQDPLEWWKLNQVQFPHLHLLAKKYLCIPANSVCSIRLFTKKGGEFSRSRNRINPRNLNAMLFLSSNIKLS